MGRQRQRLLLTAVIAFGMTMGLPGVAAAHILESDGAVSAVLHIPPADEPVAGQVTELILAFAAKDGTFSIGDYQTDVTIRHDGTVIQSGPLQPLTGSDGNAILTVTFPDPGAYTVRVSGRPLKTGAGKIKAFDLIFNVRADRTGSSAVAGLKAAGADFWSISLGSLAVVYLTGRYFIRLDRRYGAESDKQPVPVRKRQ